MRARVSGNGTVWLESLPDYKLLYILKGHTKRITCIAISPDGRLLVSGTEDGTARLRALWKIRLRRLISEPIRLEHLQLVEDILKEEKVTEIERKWMEFLRVLMRWQRRFDVELDETPRSIPGGKFDVEIDT
jgi:WD40 repeat protein